MVLAVTTVDASAARILVSLTIGNQMQSNSFHKNCRPALRPQTDPMNDEVLKQ